MAGGTPSLYPRSLLDNPVEAGDYASPFFLAEGGSASWWLCRTRSRQEKVVAQHLLARQIPFYLPLVKRMSLSRGRARAAHVPLFPGYVFVFGDSSQRQMALESNRLAHVLPVHDGEQLRYDLAQIGQLIACEAPLATYERLAVGERVRVRAGVFEGLEGTVIRRHGKSELAVSVNCLQQGALLEIADYLLETIES
mgnify:CR=1 FL=1